MKIDKKPRILFLKPWEGSTFIEKDEMILRKHFDLEVINIKKEKQINRKILKILLKKEADLIFIWFAAYYFAPIILRSKLLLTPSIVIVGGLYVANVPEIGYGQFTQNRKIKRRARFVLKHADKILVVDQSLKKDAIKNAKINGKNIDYLPTGYDYHYWKPREKKENIVLTVGNVNKIIVKRKGFYTFIKAAEYVPDAKFVLVGKHVDDSINYLKEIAPSNVEFTGYVSDEKLLELYQKAKVYCQLSRYEGLPNALCEGMLCECIPVGTRHCGIPTAIGDMGFYVPYGDEKTTAEAIKKALNAPDELGKKARERIIQMFPKERREKGLIEVIQSLVNK